MGKHGRIKDTRLDRGGPSADLSQAKTGGHSRRRTVFRLLSYVKIHWPYAVGVTVAIISGAALNLAQPWIIGFVFFNSVLGGGNLSQANLGLLPFVIFLLGLTFGLNQISSFFQVYLSEVLSQRTIHKLRSDVYQHIELLPVGVFDKSHSGDLVSRLVSDTTEVENFMEDDVAGFVSNAVTVAGALGLLFLVDRRLTLLVAPACVVLVIVVNLFKRTIKRFTARIREAFAELTSQAFEVFSGIRIVKSFRLEDRKATEFRDRSLSMTKAKVRLARLSAIYGSSVDLLVLLATLAVIWFAAPAVVSNALKLGALVAFLGVMDKMFKPLVQLSKGNLKLQKALAAADRVFELVDRDAEVLETPGSLTPQMIEGRIEFERVSFGYRPDKNVLRDLSLLIRPGETVAIVGSSGAGKSTVVNLLMRFYEPTSGRILVDGYPITSLSLGYLRSKIGLVLQEPVLFSGTIRENILYGKLQASDEEVSRASKAANAHEFIVSLQKGYDTEIGERGVTLSVGQRQRIAIARALLKDPSILILDEATSNIDSESESLIQDALRRVAKGRTLIVIGHRLSSIIDAERIVVIENGGIAEEGTHEVLMSKGGAYNRLYEAQVDRLVTGNKSPT
ncbi:ABC transporter ATP-binding protein [Candidatus Bathyarchaeota archaeon]|nr:MAG: ABC transporter ATP-binding protein [Candidatus Bathyarchaeota archaeon]